MLLQQFPERNCHRALQYGKAYQQELFRSYFGREVHYRTNQISKAPTNKLIALPTLRST